MRSAGDPVPRGLKNVVTTNIVNLWAPPRSAGPKTGHGSPRSEILATPLGGPDPILHCAAAGPARAAAGPA